MAKRLVHNYTFTPSENKIVIDYVYKPERFLIITNVTTNVTIFQFNAPNLGYASISYDYDLENTTLILDYDCSEMSSSDKLQIFVELDATDFEPSETFVDPVSKFRVSQPENLIDTDFEYGLQSTKWETLELVKNIPTFFARNGDTSYDVADVTVIEDSDSVLVTLNENHDLLSGSPVIVQGTDSITCDGTFVVTAIPSATSFRYKAKASQTLTGSIFDSVSTQIFPGSRYQGTEFTLTNIDTIITDANAASTLTVSTEFPTNFVEGTSFYLTNSVSPVTFFANAAAVTTDIAVTGNVTTTNTTATGETGFALGATQPYDYTGTEAVYFNIADCVVDTTTNVETLTFPEPHGLADSRWYLYVAGELNTVIGGLTNYTGYIIRVVNDTTIYFTTNGTTRVNLTSAGSNGGVMRSALLRGYRCAGAATASTQEYINFSETVTGAVTNRNIPLMFFNGTAGGLAVNSNLFQPTVYYLFAALLPNRLRFSTSPTGGLLGLSSTSATGLMVPAALLADRDSMYFANHGFESNDAVTFTVVAGTAPTGLANGTVYEVQKINDDRIQFLNNSTGALIAFTTAGTTNGQYRITGPQAQLTADSIFLPNHEIPDGTALIYGNAGNPNIGGLADGGTYYSFSATTDNFKLATTEAGWASAAKTFTQSASFVSVAADTITLSQTGNHGYSTGDLVQYVSTTPIGGLTSGAFYYARAVSTTVISLHTTSAGATANTDRINLIGVLSGTGTIRKAALVDLTATSTGNHTFAASVAGASDGVFTLSNSISSTSFELSGNAQVGNRIVNVASDTDIDLSRSAIRYANHAFTTGTSVTYSTTGNVIGGLTDGDSYAIIRTSRNWFQIAVDSANAEANTSITLTSVGTGTHTFTSATVTGEVLGTGLVTINADSTTALGSGTKFNAVYVSGDTFNVYGDEANTTISVSSINTTTDVLTTSAAHGLNNTDPVRMSAAVAPTGTTNNVIYYVRVLTDTTVQLHPTPDDATNDTNRIDISSSGTTVTLIHLSSIGNTFQGLVSTVNGATEMTLETAPTEAYSDATYAIGTGLFVRADGSALHRPYDGGVELIPSTNPDSTMIRQTRKYFRYQSGKGIQVSFAVNFSPTVSIDNMTWANVGGTVVSTITTRSPHRITSGTEITVSGAVASSGTNYWNGVFAVTDTPTPSTFTIALSGEPDDPVAQGLVEYYVNNWSNSLLKCGLFDDQNGLYFEYDGQDLNCCRRSSTLQISGTVSVQFKSGAVIGTGTKFASQLAQGDYIVIKGQSYLVTEIANDSLLYILPSYRGIDATNVIVTKTIDTKVPQSQWNIDPCDGTGPSGYFLDIHAIQMAYMDYSWYGAGKVRFGFKDQVGKVIYVHEFIHNNQFAEAYMRSGNLPARYEIENTGAPTYVPALAHWGTSVIMDGRFDDDRAYVFTASSQSLSLTGSSSLVISGNVETTETYQVNTGGFFNQFRTAGYAVRLANANVLYNQITSGISVTGNGLAAGSLTRNPADSRISPFQPYLAGVTSRIGGNSATQSTRNLLLVDRQPSTTAATNNYTVALSTAATSVTYEQPLISIRLAPSVDNGAPGRLGSREIINRMQLILNSVGILTTHACEVVLRLNGNLTNYDYQRVTNPSLSQLIYHDTEDRISGGTVVYSFRAQGGSGTTGRTPVLTQQDLEEIATLGNSIMGGDNPYPDGPDVLTVTVRLVEDPGFVGATNPWNVTGRISWSESQA